MEDIKAKILKNPNIILEDEEIFTAVLEAANKNNPQSRVVDIRGALIDRLNSKLVAAHARELKTIDAAKDYVAGIESVHATILDILDAKTFVAFLDELKQSVAKHFAVDSALVVLEREDTKEVTSPHSTMLVVPKGMGQEFFGTALHEDHPHIAMRIATESINDSSEPLGSEAVVKLNLGDGHVKAFLVLSSHDLDRFSPDKATDLLDFFAKVLERVLTKWLSE